MKPHDVIKYLENHGIKVLFASTFGSYGTEDWSPESDIDMFIIIESSNGKINLNLDNVHMIISTKETMNYFLNPPFIIELAFSKPIVDKIGLHEYCRNMLKDDSIVEWVLEEIISGLRIIDVILENSRGAERICGDEAIGIVNILKWALSLIENRRITKKEIVERVEKLASTSLAPFIDQHKARKNRSGRKIIVDLEACRRVLLVLKSMLINAKDKLQGRLKKHHNSIADKNSIS